MLDSLDGLRGEMQGLRGEMQSLRSDVNERLDRVNGRLDNVLIVIGSHHRELEERVKRVEDDLHLAPYP